MQAIQPEMKAQATVSAVIAGMELLQPTDESVNTGEQVCVSSGGGRGPTRCGCGQSDCYGWQGLTGVR